MSRKPSGNHPRARSPEYPEDSIQSLVSDWWKVAEDREVRRGQLLWAHIPFVGWLPYQLVPEGRSSATEHGRALFRLDQQRSRQRSEAPSLPVAALPQNPGESYAVYRAKRRPVLVLGAGGLEVDRGLTRSTAKWQSARTYLVAPYFGIEQSGQRGGWNSRFVQQIRHCEYPQYFWDRLPLSGASTSILRLDQLQPIGRHHQAFEYTPHRLSDEALEVLEQWLAWYLFDRLAEDSILNIAREELPAFD